MSWPFNNRLASLTATEMVSDRTSRRTNGKRGDRVSRDQAMRHSAVWGCLRLRADLISTMPVDIFRRVGGVQIEQAKPPVFVTPGGKQLRWTEFVYSTQVDLDSVGNTVGLITARDGLGLPARIELANADEVTFRGKGAKLTKIRIGRDEYDPEQIWHEKQYTISGCPIGLSPIAYAARTINGYLSAQEFTDDWFSNSTVPGGHLKNTAKTLKKSEANAIKENFKASVQSGDVWVSGNDWEYSMLSAKASESSFLEVIKASVPEVCRFLSVPADLIDGESGSSSITYANISQRNLQLLIINLGPAMIRREEAWSTGLLPQPRYAKLNADALLRMDPKTRSEMLGMQVEKRLRAPSEAREYDNLPPFTPDQEAEFARLFPNKAPAPAPRGAQS